MLFRRIDAFSTVSAGAELSQLIESRAAAFEYGVALCECLPPAYRDIRVMWIDFQAMGTPADLLGRYDGCPRPGEAIQHNRPAPRAIGVRDHGHRFYSRMHPEFIHPTGAECVHPGVAPNVRSASPTRA